MAVVIYVKRGCPFCIAAEKLFRDRGVDFETIDYFGLSSEKLAELAAKTDNWSTAPMIFIGEKFYGGYDDIKRLDESNHLDEILKK